MCAVFWILYHGVPFVLCCTCLLLRVNRCIGSSGRGYLSLALRRSGCMAGLLAGITCLVSCVCVQSILKPNVLCTNKKTHYYYDHSVLQMEDYDALSCKSMIMGEHDAPPSQLQMQLCLKNMEADLHMQSKKYNGCLYFKNCQVIFIIILLPSKHIFL